MNVEEIPIGAVVPNPNNSRLHSDEQVSDIARSITEFGFTLPLLIDEDNMLLAGHGRLRALALLGRSTVFAVRRVGLTPEQKRAYVIADNKIALGAEWDEQLLRIEIKELMESDYDVGVIGFDDEELNLLLTAAADPDGEEGAADGGWTGDDEAPEVPAVPVTRSGDVWVMGKHRLMCGDSTSVADMQRLVDGRLVDLWLTDPPYNVAVEGGTKEKLKIENDDMSDDKFRQFLKLAYAAADAVMKPGAAFYIWHADTEAFNFCGAAREVKWPIRQCLVWRKSTLVMGRQDYHWQHEPCLYGWKPGAAHKWFGGRKRTTVRGLADGLPLRVLPDGRYQLTVGSRTLLFAADAIVDEEPSSVINEGKPKRNESHPTMKPVALFEHQMLNSSALGDMVLDSFGGSGTTLICAQKTGRVARLMELDRKYCDVIVRRWQDYTGKQAALEANGQTFDLIAAARLAGSE